MLNAYFMFLTVVTIVIETLSSSTSRCSPVPPNSFSSSNWITLVSSKAFQVILQFHFQMHSIGTLIYLEVKLENHLKCFGRTSVIQLELEKEFGGTGLHLEVELEKVF